VSSKIYRGDDLEKHNNLVLVKSNQLVCSFHKFLREKSKTDFRDLEIESADFFVLMLRIFNALNIDLEKEHQKMFEKDCYVYFKTPCQCDFLE